MDWYQLASIAVPLGLGVATLLLKRQVKELHVLVNSRMTELLEAARGQARGEGHAEGRAEVKDEVATGAIPPLPTPLTTGTPPDQVSTTVVTTHTEVT